MDDLFRKLFNVLPGYITAQDRRFRIVAANRAFRTEFEGRVGDHCYKVYKGRSEKCEVCPVELTFQDGECRSSEEIVKLKGNDAVIRYFYPYVSPWKSIYRIRSSKKPMKEQAKNVNKMSDRITLVITGVQGRAELNWKFNANLL